MTHTPQRKNVARAPIVPTRVRAINHQSFAFVPHRFLRDGFFASLHPDELRLYFFLALAADKNGISFYHYDSICSLLEVPLETYVEARNRLIAKDLLAYDGSRFQLLSLPKRPVFDSAQPLHTHNDFERSDPATIRSMISHSFDQADRRRHNK